MHNGEPRPFISWENVRAALDSLIYLSTPRQPGPLEHLLLVDEILSHPDFPPGPHARQFALNDLLVTTIEQQYCHLRANQGREMPAPGIPVQAALAEIARDERNPETLGFGLLYFRFVRADLGLSLESFAPAVHADPRTLRRYQHHAILKLTDQLIEDEWSARIRQRRRRLLSELPLPPTKVFGRASVLKELQTLLAEQFPHCVLVTGAVGIGKSTVVQLALRDQIERGLLDHLIWLGQPLSAAFVRHALIERLIPDESSLQLRELFLLRRVAVVLDGIETLQDNDLQALEALLAELNCALVFLTTRVNQPLRSATRHIILTELDRPDAVALARHIAGHRLDNADASKIYEAAGGNPLAVKLAAQSEALTVDASELYAHVHESLDDSARRAWYALALLPPGSVYLAGLLNIDRRDIHSLSRSHLIEFAADTDYALVPSARSFIEQRCLADPRMRQAILMLLDEIMQTASPLALQIVQHVLRSNWLAISPEQQRDWIQAFWRNGVRGGHYADWSAILGCYLDYFDDAELSVAYGVCLRRLAQWSEAERVFRRAIRLAGQTGEFLNQALSLLELSVIFRHQGRYEQADQLHTQIDDILALNPDDALSDSLKLEQAAIAIDRADSALALYELSGIQQPSLRLHMLESEAYLLAGERARALELAREALDIAEPADRSEALIHALIGRCWIKLDNRDAARQHLTTAITILERTDDPFALARVQSNLAALLVEDRAYDEAESLLQSAREVQTRLGDQLGLAATDHNLRLLHIARLDTRS